MTRKESPIEKTEVNKPQKRTFLSTTLPLYVFAHFSHHLLTALPGPLLVFIRPYYGLNYSQSARVTTAFAMAYGLSQLPAGWLADHWSRKILLGFGILGVAATGILVGLSPNYVMLMVFLVLMGIAGGGYHPASTPMISNSVPPQKLGRALGIHASGGSSSFFIAPIVAAGIANFWGWKMAFIVLSVPTAIFGVIFFSLLRKQMDREKAEKASHPQVELPEEKPLPGQKRRLIAFMVLTVVAGGMAGSIAPFLPLYFTDHLGLSQAAAASIPAISNSAGLWAPVAGGFLSERIGKTPIILVTYLVGGIFIFLYGVLPWGFGYGALLLVMGIMSYLRMPVSESLIISLTSPKHRSTIYGIYYSSTQQAASLLALVMGFLIDTYGFKTVFNLTSGVVVGVTLVASIFLWRTKD
ncbi:MAG TPA: MFS transporter [Dehalococcoidales bacterium]